MKQSYEELRHLYYGQQQIPYHVGSYNHHQMPTIFEPYMYEVLLSLINHTVVIDTIRGAIRGTLTDIKPDHVVLEVSGCYYFVRIQQISWVMPTKQQTTKHFEPTC